MTILSKFFTLDRTRNLRDNRRQKRTSRFGASSQILNGAHTETAHHPESLTGQPSSAAHPDLPGKSSRSTSPVSRLFDTLQKYQDIPLRFHRQWLSNLLAGLILIAGISGVYLNVTSRAGIAGREIQSLEAEITTNQQKNADLQTIIAGTLSKINLEERARTAGFTLLAQENITYLVVPGYIPASADLQIENRPESSMGKRTSPTLPAEYTETLITWLTRQLETASTPLARSSNP